jgi:aminopeptidase N
MTRHGRGFEGLILLGAGGTAAAQDSAADLFRAHEVAHQWWGNVIRPKRWPEDRWLSEAFAEFSAMEYYKIRFDDPVAAVRLMNEQWILRLTEGQVHSTSLTGTKARHEGRTIYPVAAGNDNVYTKGPMVLQMLRYLFRVESGEDSFFPMMRDFLTRYRDRAASTEDFQEVAEEHLGDDLDWFFEQWLQRGGLPILTWDYDLGQQQGTWVVRLKAQQESPHYRLLIPIYFHFPGDRVAVRPWLIEGSSAARALALPGRPSSVTLNDNLEALVILKRH